MQDIVDIVKNIDLIYNSSTAFQVLKDFERVLDELDVYVYKNWEDGELIEGPKIERHWITCTFMWNKDKMPDPMGGKRLLDYDCKVYYKEDYYVKPKKIEKQEDFRPGTKRGKLERIPVWIVKIEMPKSLVMDMFSSYARSIETDETALDVQGAPQEADMMTNEPTVDASEVSV